MKNLAKHLKTGSSNIRGGDLETMEEVLGVKKGAVNAFAIYNDKENKVKLLVDQRLTESDVLLAFHPNDDTATMAISKEDLTPTLPRPRMAAARPSSKQRRRPNRKPQRRRSTCSACSTRRKVTLQVVPAGEYEDGDD